MLCSSLHWSSNCQSTYMYCTCTRFNKVIIINLHINQSISQITEVLFTTLKTNRNQLCQHLLHVLFPPQFLVIVWRTTVPTSLWLYDFHQSCHPLRQQHSLKFLLQCKQPGFAHLLISSRNLDDGNSLRLIEHGSRAVAQIKPLTTTTYDRPSAIKLTSSRPMCFIFASTEMPVDQLTFKFSVLTCACWRGESHNEGISTNSGTTI